MFMASDVETLAAEEGAAFGAAILAGVGAGIWPGVDEACDQAIHASECIACQPDVAKLMNERYRDYQRLYPALRGLLLHIRNTFNARSIYSTTGTQVFVWPLDRQQSRTRSVWRCGASTAAPGRCGQDAGAKSARGE